MSKTIRRPRHRRRPGGYVAAIRAAQLGFATACCGIQPYADPEGQAAPRRHLPERRLHPRPRRCTPRTCSRKPATPSKARASASARPKIDVQDDRPQDGHRRPADRRHRGPVQEEQGHPAGRPRRLRRSDRRGGRSQGRRRARHRQAGHRRHRLGPAPLPAGAGRQQDRLRQRRRARPRRGAEEARRHRRRRHRPRMGSVWVASAPRSRSRSHARDFLGSPTGSPRKRCEVFTKQGLKFRLGVKSVRSRWARRASRSSTRQGRAPSRLECRRLISVGRAPNTDGLNRERRICAERSAASSRSTTTARPTCPVSGRWATSCGPMLAHKAMEEAVMVAERIAGQAGH